jgi:large repetitive protein
MHAQIRIVGSGESDAFKGIAQMVAVYTGSGLGLFNTSLTQLGNAGGGRIGQGASSQYVNLSTGNLVLQDLDESLLVRGFGTALLRTYNSRGSVAGQGQDGWVTGYERNLVLSGTLNAAGSTMNLIVGDGQTVAFAWSGTANRYVATGGDGAHDTLTWDGASATWTLVEGSSQREEQFANHADAVLKGRLQRIRDLRSDSGAPAQYDVVYDAQGRVSEVRAVDGAGSGADAIVFGYNGAGQLATIHTRENGVLRSQVSYGYEFADGSGRLAWVQTDLTPHDAGDNTWDAAVPGNNDGRLFRTSYTYVSASAGDLRIAGITTGDGVTVAYTYEADGVGGHRVKSVTLGGGVDALPQTTTFVYRGNATDVVDGNGRTWTYEYDADRQLTAVIEPAIDGLRRKTEYRYDAAGNLTRMLQSPFVGAAAQLDTTFEYDANGNRTLQRDLLGNTVTWAYNAANQVATESRYTVPAMPAQGKASFTPPSGELSRQYVYDSRNRLRFEIDAAGSVRELIYATGGNGIGQVASERRYLGATYSGAFDEASLSAWATNATAMRRANSALTVYNYDAKGRLAQAVTYATVSADANGNGLLDAATSIVNRVHDAQGLLRQTITVHGPGRTVAGAPPAGSEVTDYVYDGMGRLLSVLSRNASTSAMPDARTDPAGHAAWLAANDANTVLTTYAYADSGRQVWTTHDTGLIRLDEYTRTGQLGIVTEFGASGVDNRYTYHYYDGNGQLRGSRDASGGMRYFFYDEAGRLTGTVDETGAVVETRYDGAGRPVQTIAYASRVDTSAWLSMTKGMAKHVVKNRLLFSETSPKPGDEDVWVRIDAANDRSASRSYDGAGRLATDTDAAGLVTTYVYDGASRLIATTVAKPGDATVVPRTTRMFHDAEGRLRAVLDAAGYLVETVHDAGGRAVKTIRYAKVTNAAYWANGTLDQLRPVADTVDQTTRLFYNARSQQIGMLDAEGYLTEFVYDDANHQRAVKNYAKRLIDLNGDESFAALSVAAMTDAPPEPFRLTQRSYNALGQLFLELNHEGTVTRHSYDEAGRLVKTEAAQTTSEIRAGNLRYDLFGNLIGELSGQGSTHLLPGMTEAQIDAVYAQYGVRHSYDLVGRRIESIDAAGNKTWYFHDAAGRETFVVRGMHDDNNLQNAQGEVVETRYNAFGDIVDSIAYTGRITLAIPGSRASAQSAIAALSIGGTDSRVQLRYDTRGLLNERIDAEGYRTLYAYTAFGELWTQQDLEANGSVRRTFTNTYDIRGLLTGQSETGGTLSRSMGAIHDAFGRVTTRTDARGNTVSIGYDRLGRTISQTANNVSGRNETVRMAYDAFGRTVELTDALGRITRYVHSDSARSVTTITPENVRVTTTFNRFGQIFTVSQTLPGGTVATTTTNYDRDGRILDVTDPLQRTDRNEYDARGLLVATVDGSDRRVEYRYDAAGRVLRTIEDPNGLALTTTTTYDGQGRTLTVVDASGRETRMTYDRKGNLTESLVDPTGLALRTTYSWDRDGRQLTMTEGAGTAAARTVSYGYDRFGRRITETVAPGTLDLVTSYEYDANDNVVRRTDASGRVTRYSYDAADRLRFSVDAAGGVTEVAYDAAGRVKMTRTYAAAAVISALASAPSEAEVAALIANQSLRNDAKDDTRYTVHDRDGRVALMVDGAGGVVAVGYDSAGRAVTERRHAQKVPLSAALRESLRLGTATVADVGASADAKDMFVRQVYDAAGQAAFTVDAVGAIVRMHYDGAGRTVARVRYATTVNPAAIGDATTVAQLAAAVTPSTADQIEYFVHDAAGRLRYTLTGAGTLAQTGYDAAGRATLARQFAVAMTVTAALRIKLLAGSAVESDFSAFVDANAATARAEYRVHDAAGRVRFTVARADAGQGVVAEVRYDASGQVVSSLQYGAMVAFDPSDTASELTAALSSAESRIARFAYDSAGRQRFALDATGALTETRYDGAGRVTDTIAYGQRPPAGTTSFSALVAWANAQPLDSLRHARTVYDAAGRLHIDTNALNQSEVHEYDGAGRKVARTDRNGKVWLYAHDAAGNVVAEHSPTVTVATVAADGSIGSAVRSIATRYTYDANGNLLSRTENADDPDVAQRRTTDYEYDSRGHQVRIVFADPGAVDPATGAIHATGTRPTIDIVYDALGQAVMQKDVRDHYSYRVYDALGRLVHEIDQEKQVTSYGYNVYGEQTSVRRHANDLGAIAGWADGQAISLAQMQADGQPVASLDDRTLVTHYDLRGLKTKVELSTVAYRTANGLGASGTPTTTCGYNAYGDQTTESVLLEGVPGTGTEKWATTYRYHDALGRNTLTVDALGYVTETEYNATGEATKTLEYARALTQTPDIAVRPGLPAPGDTTIGADRITRWTYDALGRKASETSVRQYRRPDGSIGSRDVTTVLGYDGEGRVTSLTDDTGTTTTTYDAMGRALSVQEPVRDVVVQGMDVVLGASTNRDLTTGLLYEQRSPYTTMAYDAFGNAVEVRRYANGRNGTQAAVADDARDQLQRVRYDRQGRAVWMRDGEGAVVTRSFDAADNVTGVRYTLTGNDGRSAVVRIVNTYDWTGRQESTLTTRDLLLGGSPQGSVVDTGETVTYNAFGEIATKTLHGLSGTLVYTYDAAGRMIGSNESGASREFGYNLAGHQVYAKQRAYLSTAGGVDTVVDAVTLTRVDKLGRTLQVVLPSHTADPATTSTLTQAVDRWGNVLRIVDTRGYRTDYEYNSINQLVREIRPLVKVVSENGGVEWRRPENQRYYDALGRLVATRDANGNLRTTEYDATGRMVASRDAYGNATRFAYDALGNQRATQNPLGYLAFKEYDRMGRVVAIGDYLPSANGATRDKAYLQRYVLNENGDRLRVANVYDWGSRYDYDSRNQLIRSETHMGVVMEYAYDAAARKTRERNALSIAANAPTWVDREGETVRLDESSWNYDVFGRLIDHNNLSGRDSDYEYNAESGQLRRETGVGGQSIAAPAADRRISYYANGRIRQVIEGTSTYAYEYDAAGNKTLEEVTTTDAYGLQVRTRTRTTYDSNNRVERVTQDDLSNGKRIFDLLTEYDANGNRRHVRALSGYGPNVDAIPVVNNAPVAIRPIDDRTVRKGMTSEFRLLFSDIFRDAEQNALTLVIAEGDGTALPVWLQVAYDPVTGEIVFVANPAANLADQDIVVRLTASEVGNPGNAANATFTVRVRTNTAPVPIASGDIALHVKAGQPWHKDLVAADYFRDADVGDVLTLGIDNALPSWVSVDATTPGVIRLSGTPQGSGGFTLQLRARDQLNASVVKQFNITHAPNSAPSVVAVPAPVDAIIGRQFEWSRDLPEVFVDSDGDRMQITAALLGGAALPEWMSFQSLYDQATPQIVFGGNVPTDEVDGRTYNIVLTATDVDGASSSTTLAVRVFANRAPTATAGTQTLTLRQNDAFTQTLPLSSLFNDPENDALNLTALWPQGSVLPHWLKMTVDHAARTVTFSKIAGNTPLVGTFAFSVRATDIAGLAGTKTFSVVVGADNAPVRSGVALPDRTLSINRTFTYTLPDGLFTDPDGDAFVLHADLIQQAYDPEPGIPNPYSVEYLPLPSWMSFNAATRTFSGLVPANQSTPIILRVTARDSRGLTNVVNDTFVGAANVNTDGDIRISFQTWTNTAPTYTAGALQPRSGIEGQPVDFVLPANAFVEPDGDPLTYSAQVQIGANWVDIATIGLAIDAATGRITGTLANLTQSTYTVRIQARDPQQAPASGTFALSVSRKPVAPASLSHQVMLNQAFSYTVPGFSDPEGGTLTYTARMANGAALPAWLSFSSAGVLGGTGTTLATYAIEITATDPSGLSSSTILQLAVANNPPVYTPGSLANQAAQPSLPFNYTVPANAFTDPNGDALTYSADWNNGPLPAWLSFDPTTRVFSGTPTSAGSWTIRVIASDGASTASATFTISTANLGPVLNMALPVRVAPVNTAVSWPLPAGAITDPNGDALTYTLEVQLPGYMTLRWVPGDNAWEPEWVDPVWVAATVSNVGLSIVANGTNGGTISGTLKALQSRGNDIPQGTTPVQTTQTNHNYSLRIVARDPAGSSVSGAFQTIANVPPVGPSIGTQTARQNVLYSFVAPAFTDVNNQTLTYSMIGLPAGLSFHAPSRTISGTPTGSGPATVQYTANDGSGGTTTVSFTLNVQANNAPAAPSVSAQSGTLNVHLSFALPAFTDADFDTLTYGIAGLPPGLTFDAVSRTISGTPTAAGTWTVTYTANDGRGGTTSVGTDQPAAGGEPAAR